MNTTPNVACAGCVSNSFVCHINNGDMSAVFTAGFPEMVKQ